MKKLAIVIWQEIVWQFVTKTLVVILFVGARIRVKFYGSVPRRGSFILATNHVSHFDPPFITTTFPRKIDWIAVRELFGTSWSNRLFTDLNVIPVDRSGADRSALRTAVKRLQDGRVIGIFPEGGIRDGEKSLVNGAEMKPGVALLAAMSGAPVVPGVILGSERLYNKRNWLPWRRSRVWIAYGDPIAVPDSNTKRDQVQQALARAIIELKDRLVAEFGLTENDMPHSPQERMKEP